MSSSRAKDATNRLKMRGKMSHICVASIADHEVSPGCVHVSSPTEKTPAGLIVPVVSTLQETLLAGIRSSRQCSSKLVLQKELLERDDCKGTQTWSLDYTDSLTQACGYNTARQTPVVCRETQPRALPLSTNTLEEVAALTCTHKLIRRSRVQQYNITFRLEPAK